MKKFILPLLLALGIGVLTTSCDDEVLLESTNTFYKQVTLNWNNWYRSSDGYMLVHEEPWNALTADVLNYGNVNAYVYDGDRQCPLPYVYPIDYYDNTGTYIGTTPTNLRVEFEPGKIIFIREDLDGNPVGDITGDDPIVFRVVATVPVEYILER